MTLKASASNISIQNSSGTDMFNSNDKLLYRKNYYSGSVSLGPSVTTVLVPLSGAVSDANTLFVVQSKITFCNGNFGAGFVNSIIDLSSSVLTNFAYSTTSVDITENDYLSVAIQRTTSASNLEANFSYVSIGRLIPIQLGSQPSASSINLDYYISVFGWT
jgi:hypothetical protein